MHTIECMIVLQHLLQIIVTRDVCIQLVINEQLTIIKAHCLKQIELHFRGSYNIRSQFATWHCLTYISIPCHVVNWLGCFQLSYTSFYNSSSPLDNLLQSQWKSVSYTNLKVELLRRNGQKWNSHAHPLSDIDQKLIL